MKNKLWTKDFTIITVGSVISMLGSTLSGFAMSLLVLDYTGSTFLFATYNVLYFLPSAIIPVLCGPFLDRFSRRKTIYVLDFVTAALYVAMTFLLWRGIFNFVLLAACSVLLGAIGSVYFVAYDSFYPLLISEGNYQKAYSVASTLETLTMVMVPVSALVYNTVGIVPLFAFDAATYFIAAVMETRISDAEKYLEDRRITDGKVGRRLAGDFMEGMRYLWSEKGLLAVAVYFGFSALAGGATGAVTLPYFKNTFENGEYIFMLVWGAGSLARALGGAVHYNLKLPVKRKFAIAFCVYILLAVLEGGYLYFPIPVMMGMCFADGLLGITSYTIRIAATQKYVPDDKKGRFNGAFNTISTVGNTVGGLAAGALAEFMNERYIVTGFMAVVLVAALTFIGGRRKDVARIYNVED